MPVVENEVTATKEYKDEQQQQQQSLLKHQHCISACKSES